MQQAWDPRMAQRVPSGDKRNPATDYLLLIGTSEQLYRFEIHTFAFFAIFGAPLFATASDTETANAQNDYAYHWKEEYEY
jgi:hypothetical protein